MDGEDGEAGLPGPSTAIEIQDEGTALGSVTTINFAGAGVTATVAGKATVTIPGGGASSVAFATIVKWGRGH